MSEQPAPSIGATEHCEYADCPGTMTLEEQRVAPKRSLGSGARAGSRSRLVVWQCDAQPHHRREERGTKASEG